jgi:hypothetical protein
VHAPMEESKEYSNAILLAHHPQVLQLVVLGHVLEMVLEEVVDVLAEEVEVGLGEHAPVGLGVDDEL